MPLYNFRCDSCGHEAEQLMTIREKEELGQLSPCPECEKETFRSVFGKSTFKLKGEGWAHDNYTKTTDANMHTGRKT